MFTVVRFSSEPSVLRALEALGAVSLGVAVGFDVAMEPEDGSLRSVVLDNALLSVLAEARVTFEVSVYR